MARDELGPITGMEFQQEVLAGNLYPESPPGRKVGPVYDDTVVAEAWRWCIENGENPRHAENSMNRYSTNFSPATGSPLVLGEEPPDEVQEEYPEFTVPDEWEYTDE